MGLNHHHSKYVVVYAPFAICETNFGVPLEILQRHIDAGDRVTFLGCDADMQACDFNLGHQVTQCWRCMSRRKNAISLLSEQIASGSFLSLTSKDKDEMARLRTDFNTIEELKAYTVNDFDIGYGVLSTMVSALRDPEPDLQRHAQIVKDLLMSSLKVYLSIKNYLATHQVDVFYSWNVRHAPTRPVFCACQEARISCHVIDKADEDHYVVFDNRTLHDIAYNHHLICETWNNATSHENREAVASAFYNNKRHGKERIGSSYLAKQQNGKLPTNWRDDRRNIVIYTSSEDEFVSIGPEWDKGFFKSQKEGIRFILELLRDLPGDFHFYHRVHPHTQGVRNQQYISEFLSIKSDNLTVLGPEDPVSTYALLDRADKVVTFGSTVGIEAVFWEKPSVLLGPSMYQNLGGTYNPCTLDELQGLLTANLPPKDKKAALMYGFYMNSHGTPFKYYKNGLFNGSKVTAGVWSKLAFRAENALIYRLGHPMSSRGYKC